MLYTVNTPAGARGFENKIKRHAFWVNVTSDWQQAEDWNTTFTEFEACCRNFGFCKRFDGLTQSDRKIAMLTPFLSRLLQLFDAAALIDLRDPIAQGLF